MRTSLPVLMCLLFGSGCIINADVSSPRTVPLRVNLAWDRDVSPDAVLAGTCADVGVTRMSYTLSDAAGTLLEATDVPCEDALDFELEPGVYSIEVSGVSSASSWAIECVGLDTQVGSEYDCTVEHP